MISESLGQDSVTERKHVKVLSTLQLKSHPSIFAVGDIIDWNEQKQAAKTAGHASTIVANVLNLLGGSKPQKQYKSGPEMILITNGRVSLDYFPFDKARVIDPAVNRMVVPCTLASCGDWCSAVGPPRSSSRRTWV